MKNSIRLTIPKPQIPIALIRLPSVSIVMIQRSAKRIALPLQELHQVQHHQPLLHLAPPARPLPGTTSEFELKIAGLEVLVAVLDLLVEVVQERRGQLGRRVEQMQEVGWVEGEAEPGVCAWLGESEDQTIYLISIFLNERDVPCCPQPVPTYPTLPTLPAGTTIQPSLAKALRRPAEIAGLSKVGVKYLNASSDSPR